MLLDELFARTNTGAVQSWTVEVEGDQYRTVYGQVGGKFQTTNWTKCYTTNEGRVNERNPEQQALFEAEALWKKKLESGYFKNIEDVDNETFIEPMLAKKFEDYEDELVYPVYSQMKLDGCLRGDTLVETKEGKVPIKNIVEGTEVFTFNTHTSTTELKKVRGVYKNGIDVSEKTITWFKITLEDGKILVLTGNHRVWVSNLKCWRRADQLDGTEDLLLF